MSTTITCTAKEYCKTANHAVISMSCVASVKKVIKCFSRLWQLFLNMIMWKQGIRLTNWIRWINLTITNTFGHMAHFQFIWQHCTNYFEKCVITPATKLFQRLNETCTKLCLKTYLSKKHFSLKAPVWCLTL